MIGLALVTLVATLAAGIVHSFTSAVDDIFTGDYSITAQNNFTPIPIAAAEAAAKTPGVIAVGSVRTGEALVFGKTIFATAVDPGREGRDRPDWIEGLAGDVWRARRRRRLRRRRLREEARPRRSDRRSRSRSSTARPRRSRSRESSTRRPGARRSAPVTISAATWDANNPDPKNIYSFVTHGPAARPTRIWPRSRRRSPTFPNAKAPVPPGLHRQPDLRAQARSSTSSTCCSRSRSSSASSASSTRSC